jgi:hypothetical protein
MHNMHQDIENKLYAMFWDLTPVARKDKIKNILRDPVAAFRDEQVFLRALNSLNWYELIQLAGSDHLLELLNNVNLNHLFPESRRKYYRNAKSLLSKYIISAAG